MESFYSAIFHTICKDSLFNWYHYRKNHFKVKEPLENTGKWKSREASSVFAFLSSNPVYISKKKKEITAMNFNYLSLLITRRNNST